MIIILVSFGKRWEETTTGSCFGNAPWEAFMGLATAAAHGENLGSALRTGVLEQVFCDKREPRGSVSSHVVSVIRVQNEHQMSPK